MIEEDKLKFEKSDGPTKVEYPSRAKAKMTKQEKEAPKKAISKKATMPKEKVPITKTGRSGASYSLATERSKERSYAPNGEQEKNMLWDSAQGLERTFVKRNECISTLIEEHNSRTFKRKQILRDNEA